MARATNYDQADPDTGPGTVETVGDVEEEENSATAAESGTGGPTYCRLKHARCWRGDGTVEPNCNRKPTVMENQLLRKTNCNGKPTVTENQLLRKTNCKDILEFGMDFVVHQ
jgi:hypothetical protein